MKIICKYRKQYIPNCAITDQKLGSIVRKQLIGLRIESSADQKVVWTNVDKTDDTTLGHQGDWREMYDLGVYPTKQTGPDELPALYLSYIRPEELDCIVRIA